jgi:hypothetical protein
MVEQQKNPLAGYFRQPAIYLKIPSLGRWWPAGSIDLPDSNEIPIYPMTARDEISIRTPDALLNGQGVVDVVQSCCPNIKNAWMMPSVDTDALLISIRIATYGNMMDIKSRCPHCGENNDHEVDLGNTLTAISCPTYERTANFKGLKIKLRPQSYRNINKASMITFEEQKLLSALDNDNITDEQKLAEISKNMKRIADLGFDNLVGSTDFIEMPDGDRVADQQYLREFYQNSENELVSIVQKVITETVEEHKIKPVNLQCQNCQENYTSELSFDFSNFFAKGF